MRTGTVAGHRALGRRRMCHMTPTQQRALSDGAIAAAGGAAVGAMGGSPALGATLGGAAGTAVGALWEDIHKALKEKHAHGAP